MKILSYAMLALLLIVSGQSMAEQTAQPATQNSRDAMIMPLRTISPRSILIIWVPAAISPTNWVCLITIRAICNSFLPRHGGAFYYPLTCAILRKRKPNTLIYSPAIISSAPSSCKPVSVSSSSTTALARPTTGTNSDSGATRQVS